VFKLAMVRSASRSIRRITPVRVTQTCPVKVWKRKGTPASAPAKAERIPALGVIEWMQSNFSILNNRNSLHSATMSGFTRIGRANGI
jgi:hypothetical protein